MGKQVLVLETKAVFRRSAVNVHIECVQVCLWPLKGKEAEALFLYMGFSAVHFCLCLGDDLTAAICWLHEV